MGGKVGPAARVNPPIPPRPFPPLSLSSPVQRRGPLLLLHLGRVPAQRGQYRPPVTWPPRRPACPRRNSLLWQREGCAWGIQPDSGQCFAPQPFEPRAHDGLAPRRLRHRIQPCRHRLHLRVGHPTATHSQRRRRRRWVGLIEPDAQLERRKRRARGACGLDRPQRHRRRNLHRYLKLEHKPVAPGRLAHLVAVNRPQGEHLIQLRRPVVLHSLRRQPAHLVCRPQQRGDPRPLTNTRAAHGCWGYGLRFLGDGLGCWGEGLGQRGGARHRAGRRDQCILDPCTVATLCGGGGQAVCRLGHCRAR
eukprot:scaffold3962_cov122-Isochrysis_galbana.AAC.10